MSDNNFPSAKIVAHSQAPNGEELITLEIELHRFILPEFNTHRSFSRNFQSSRAVPIESMIKQVRDNPALPVHWGKNQKGMVAEQEHNSKVVFNLHQTEYDGNSGSPWYTNEEAWRSSAIIAAQAAEDFNNAGYHKQIVNRLLEPFMRTKGVVTATRKAYEAFFKLRCHKDAQPEIKLLAERMRSAIERSEPTKLKYGEYHLPYVHIVQDHYTTQYTEYYNDLEHNVKYSTESAVKVSTSCTAQVSYRRLDDSLEKALKVYDMLNLPVNGVYPEDPPHYSPTEHIAKIVDPEDVSDAGYHGTDIGGNFNSRTFWQYRKALESGMEQQFLEE